MGGSGVCIKCMCTDQCKGVVLCVCFFRGIRGWLGIRFCFCFLCVFFFSLLFSFFSPFLLNFSMPIRVSLSAFSAPLFYRFHLVS